MLFKRDMVQHAVQKGHGATCCSKGTWCNMLFKRDMVQHAVQKGRRATCCSKGTWCNMLFKRDIMQHAGLPATIVQTIANQFERSTLIRQEALSIWQSMNKA